MQIVIACMMCMNESIEKGIIPPEFSLANVDINNQFYYITTCKQGHKFITLLQTERFEVLFDFACCALLDGYYRETVSSTAAAVERYHEFFLKVLAVHNGIPMDKFKDMWDWVISQSERQLGMFYMEYLREFKLIPPKFVEKNAKFRNKVIHKGYIPNEAEAREYAKEAFYYIISTLWTLKSSSYNDSIGKVILMDLKRIRDDIPAGNKLQVSTMCNCSVINLMSGEADWKDRKFEEALGSFDEYRKRVEGLSSCLQGK